MKNIFEIRGPSLVPLEKISVFDEEEQERTAHNEIAHGIGIASVN